MLRGADGKGAVGDGVEGEGDDPSSFARVQMYPRKDLCVGGQS